MQTPERLPSPVCKTFLGILASSLDYSNSERTQQYGADKCEHGEHRQHIEPQGKVHGSSPFVRLDLSLSEQRPSPNDKYSAVRKSTVRGCPTMMHLFSTS